MATRAPQTLSDLKRKLAVGTKVRLITWMSEDGLHDFTAHHKGAGVSRTVRVVRSSGVYLGLATTGLDECSYLPWPKAGDIQFYENEPDKFSLHEKNEHRAAYSRVLTYRIET